MMSAVCLRCRRPLAASLALAVMLGAQPAVAGRQSAAPDVAVLAAFLYSFARFTEWPKLPGGATLVACVVGNDDVAQALTGIVQGKTIAGHGLMVRRPTDSAAWGDCHLLHVGDGLTSRFSAGLAGIRQLPVLTTSDAKGFSRSGGIAELYIEGGQMRFVINLDAVERSGLRLSSRLLGLATVIRDRDARPDLR